MHVPLRLAHPDGLQNDPGVGGHHQVAEVDLGQHLLKGPAAGKPVDRSRGAARSGDSSTAELQHSHTSRDRPSSLRQVISSRVPILGHLPFDRRRNARPAASEGRKGGWTYGGG